MNKQLKNFILCIKNIPKLKEMFISSKNLEESYNKFKIMLNGCTFEEYKNFFETLVNKTEELSEEDLMNVAGGVSLKRIMTPLALMSIIMSNTPSMVFAEDYCSSGFAQTETSSIQMETQMDTESYQEKPEEIIVSYDDKNEDEVKVDRETFDQLQSDTTEGEINFSSKVIESLPKKGQPNFDKFLKLPDQDKLTGERVVTINHKDGTKEEKTINERELYKEIEEIVKQLIAKVDSRTPGEDMTDEEIDIKIANGEVSKHYKLSREMRIAKAIYRWVSKNIILDYDSVTVDTYNPYRKEQDAISVYANKAAVCQGYSRLINLMMHMAGIPSAHITSTGAKDSIEMHAFNVIYLDDAYQGRSGWTLIDACWGASLVQGDVVKPGWDIKMFFPAFYNSQSSLQDANRSILKHEAHKIMDIATSTDLNDELGDDYYYSFKIDNIKYNLYGHETDSLISISGDYNNPSENVRISEEISSLNLPFRIGWGIKSISLNGDERLVGTDATSNAEDLEFIQFGSIKCSSYLKSPFIWCDMERPAENVYIPETLSRLSVPIRIGLGIRSIILTGDEIIDISFARDLETIDTTHSNKYIMENGVLYEKTELGEKGNQVGKIGQ